MEIVLFSEVRRLSGGLMCINLPLETSRVSLDFVIFEPDVTAKYTAYRRFSLQNIYNLFII
jgi:hypothetical protein